MKRQRDIQRTVQAGIKRLTLLLLLVLLMVGLRAQNMSATFVVDSNHIQIADQLNLRLNVRYTRGLTPMIPQFRDTIGELEIVREGKRDTVRDGDMITQHLLYVVSAYDSGQFSTGRQMLHFVSPTGRMDTIETNELLIDVATVPVDTAKPLKPIKAPLELPYTWNEFLYYYLAGSVLLLLLVALLLWWRYVKNRKPVVVERPKPKEPAQIWAKKELKKLEDEKIWQQGDGKAYYTRLTEILRLYVEYQFGWYAMEATTAEIESDLEKYNVKMDAAEKLLSVLQQADLVKFAKLLPPPDENMKNMERAYAFVELTTPRETTQKQQKDV